MKNKIKTLVLAITITILLPARATCQGFPVYDNTNFISLAKTLIESAKQTSELLKTVKFLKEQKEFWEGLCEINFEVSQAVIEEVDSHAVLNECIREVIRESINNAIKHAKSSQMKIELKLSRDSIVNLIVLNSTNQPITATSASNFGSRLFEELTDSWEIEYRPDSTELRASFKVKQSV